MGFANRMNQHVTKYKIGMRMKKWWWYVCLNLDVVLQGVNVWYHINKDEGDESLCSSSFLKRCYQCHFSEIFKGRQIMLELGRNLKYHIRCLLWWHKTLLGTIWTQTYSQPIQTSKMECYCVINEQLKVVNWLLKHTSF